MTAPSIKEALELKPCPFCNGKGRLYQSQNAAALWRVCCENCDAGPHSHIGRDEAIKRWNTRATLSPPAGERREAIAQALLDRFIERGHARIQGSMFPRGTKINQIVHSYRDDFYADADAVILASGLVQDEAGWRDISSAPKDGTDILVLVEESGEQFVCYFDGRCWRYATFPGGVMVCAPDHWMPLPAPPIRSARNGGAES